MSGVREAWRLLRTDSRADTVVGLSVLAALVLPYLARYWAARSDRG